MNVSHPHLRSAVINLGIRPPRKKRKKNKAGTISRWPSLSPAVSISHSNIEFVQIGHDLGLPFSAIPLEPLL